MTAPYVTADGVIAVLGGVKIVRVTLEEATRRGVVCVECHADFAAQEVAMALTDLGPVYLCPACGSPQIDWALRGSKTP